MTRPKSGFESLNPKTRQFLADNGLYSKNDLLKLFFCDSAGKYPEACYSVEDVDRILDEVKSLLKD